MRKSVSGFTIVELLIVIVVIAILAAISVVAYSGLQKRAQASAVVSALSQASKKIAVAQVDNTTVPNCTEFYTLITSKTDSTACTFDNGSINYQYKQTPDTTNPTGYCVTATNGATSYNVSNTNNSPASGGCDGHGSGGVAPRTNITLNPNFESNGNNWGLFWNPIISRTGAEYHSGSWSFRVEQSAANTTDNRAGGIVLGGTAPLTLTEGMIFRASFWMKMTPGAYILASYKYNTGYVGHSPIWTASNGSWQWVQLPTYTIQAADVSNTTKHPLQINIVNANGSSNAPPAGTSVFIDDVMFETFPPDAQLPSADYKDGNSPSWSWSGTPNGSSSTGPAF